MPRALTFPRIELLPRASYSAARKPRGGSGTVPASAWQVPRRLPSAALTGGDFPTKIAARFVIFDAFRRLVLTPDAARCKVRQRLPLSTLERAPAPPATTEDDRSIADRVYFVWNTFVLVRLAPLGDAWRPYRMIEAYSFAGRLPGAWRCNTLGTRIVFAGTGQIAPLRGPSRHGLYPLRRIGHTDGREAVQGRDGGDKRAGSRPETGQTGWNSGMTSIRAGPWRR